MTKTSVCNSPDLDMSSSNSSCLVSITNSPAHSLLILFISQSVFPYLSQSVHFSVRKPVSSEGCLSPLLSRQTSRLSLRDKQIRIFSQCSCVVLYFFVPCVTLNFYALSCSQFLCLVLFSISLSCSILNFFVLFYSQFLCFVLFTISLSCVTSLLDFCHLVFSEFDLLTAVDVVFL